MIETTENSVVEVAPKQYWVAKPKPVPSLPKPEFDYINWPQAPRVGLRGFNGKHLTRGIFMEHSEEPEHVKWTLEEDEQWFEAGQCWLPSAQLTYIYAKDEYDGLRKICGNARQWELLVATPWFKPLVEEWHVEQAHIQRTAMREVLLETALQPGTPGAITAARTILQLIDGKAIGRPKKERNSADPAASEVDKDAERILKLVKG